jgi:hypothetical protein
MTIRLAGYDVDVWRACGLIDQRPCA